METATSDFLSRTSISLKSTYETTMFQNSSEATEPSSSSKAIFDYIQFVCTTLGFVGNLLTLITLSRNGKRFSRLILILFQHQSFCDCLVCGMASAVILQPHLWMSGNKIFDYFVCHCWHSQVSSILIRITSIFYQLRFHNYQIRSCIPRIVAVFVNRPLTIQASFSS